MIPAAFSAAAHSRTAGMGDVGLGTTWEIETPALRGPAAAMNWSAPTKDRLEVGTILPWAAISFCNWASGPESTVLRISCGACAIIASTSALPTTALRLIAKAWGARLIFLR